MKMPGRIEVGAVMGGELHLLDRPALSVRQVLGLQPVEELQHARQALLVIDVLDGGMPTRWIGRYVVLQRHGNVDQSSGHMRFLEDCCCYSFGVRTLCVLALDLVLEDADFFNLKLDGIAVFEIPAEFESAAVADGA